ncbi:hypothetical protein AKJ37_07540 [candidate division MSBL1 archaeon SCGC-AAA259I09]|uniref:PIN domain-containing protein n=2 Tax=candidate division MSBL1 TaxID=215777 RepID=A0A133UPB3_9EURY|nr:hypothetical protein AKJ37_07540 [candidate division MSBL1 archaeon SCGC-AAA259I09]KXA96039.1 hypothetical protein AKJ38_04055 [candidate division MSBL1 archaeon SCGC-AAA259I14]
MKFLCDTDLLSVFAKVESLDLIRKAFPKGDFVISESVYDELSVSTEEGFDFPKRIFVNVEIVGLNQSEESLYRKRREKSKYLTISKADLKTLIMASERNLPILSNDGKLLELADQENVPALDIYDVFKILFRKGKLPEKEIRDILSNMEKKDNAFFKDKGIIFE